MSQEHANSYTVDTSGIKQVVADLTGNTGYRSKTAQLAVLHSAVAQLQERVIALENQNKIYNANFKTLDSDMRRTLLVVERLQIEVAHLKMRQ